MLVPLTSVEVRNHIVSTITFACRKLARTRLINSVNILDEGSETAMTLMNWDERIFDVLVPKMNERYHKLVDISHHAYRSQLRRLFTAA
ncbi:MAG TPA: hypothetical protein VHL14_04755 [Steroidobacteraceae bacterium]|nr:hypothetical protein [Steroidobacteraceae bacterium]